MDYKAKSRALIERYYQIADEMSKRAVELTFSGEDIRTNKNRPGLGALLHYAQKAIDEIVRLTPLCIDQDVLAGNDLVFTFRDPDWDHLAKNVERLRSSMGASEDEAPN